MSAIETAGKILNLARPIQPAAVSEPLAATDVALVDAVRAGDREAFGQLYALYAPMVHGILLARVPYRDVDDLVQEVFLAALKRLQSLRESAAFGGWLAMITRNRAVDYYRRARETEELTDDLPVASHRDTEAEHEAARMLDIVRSLPEAYRETLVMRLVEGMSGPEIAARTGMTPASVRVNLHRGMKMLREKLGLEGRA